MKSGNYFVNLSEIIPEKNRRFQAMMHYL